MNIELALKCGTGLLSLGCICYTTIKVSAGGNGASIESPYESITLRKQMEAGNERLIYEIRGVKSEMQIFKDDVDKRMSGMESSFNESNSKTAKELKYLLGLATHIHLDVELMKNWNFSATDSYREKYMKEMIAGQAGGESD